MCWDGTSIDDYGEDLSVREVWVLRRLFLLLARDLSMNSCVIGIPPREDCWECPVEAPSASRVTIGLNSLLFDNLFSYLFF